jgi:hypothetical protein
MQEIHIQYKYEYITYYVCVNVCGKFVVQFAITDLWKLDSFSKSLEELPFVSLSWSSVP